MECGEGVCVAMPVSGGSTAQDQKGENWVELEYLDAVGKPVGGAKYVVMDAEGTELASGSLDANGFAHVGGLPPDVHTVQYYFDDDPAEYVIAEEYKPKPNPIVDSDPSFWEKTKQKLSEGWDWTWGVFQGDFNEDPSISQIVARTVLTLIPVVDQIGDAQDIIAALKKLIFDKRYDDAGVWFDLIISIIGCIPEIGSVFKAIAKALKLEAKTLDMFKLLRRLDWAGSGNAFRFIKKLRGDLSKHAATVTKKLEEVLSALVWRLYDLRKWASTRIKGYIDTLVVSVNKVRALAPGKVKEVFDYLAKRLDEVIESAKRLIKSGETRKKHTVQQGKEPIRAPDPAKTISKRKKYLGATPGKKSRTGREVMERMKKEGNLKELDDGSVIVRGSDEKWYPLEEMDMAHHPQDAVNWWNTEGYKHGPKSEGVRDWMLDPNNYTLDHRSLNRSAGAKLGEVYRDPL